MYIPKTYTTSFGKTYAVAPFLLRLLAFVIDSALIFIIGNILDIYIIRWLAPELFLRAMAEWVIIDQGLMFFIIGFPYHLVAEQSSWQGSIGKRIFAIMVVDADVDKPSFWQSLLRNLLKFIIVAFIPLLTIDAIITWPLTLVLFWVIILIMAVSDNYNRFLSDYPTKSFVLQRKSKRL